MKVSIVYSLPSLRMRQSGYGETDTDTAEIAKMVARGLAARGMESELWPIGESEIEKISEIKADCIFNLIEWCGRDIRLAEQAFGYLRATNIPVTGSDEKLFVLTGDKVALKARLEHIAAPVPRSQIFTRGDEPIELSLPYPVIVKPALEHCSTGIGRESLASNASELARLVEKQISMFEQPVLAQEFVKGRELLVYLLERETGVIVLPIVEIFFLEKGGMGFQTYESKWVEESKDYRTTTYDIAQLDPFILRRIEELCEHVFTELGFWGYARFDIRLRDDEPMILETNANPSVYDATEEIESMEDEVIEGIRFADYLEEIVKSAIRHYQRGERV